MSRLCSMLVASTLVACGGGPPQFRVGGRITHETLEGGFWSIRGDDGVTYDPLNLAAQYQKDGLPVLATLVLRPDMGSAHMVGPIVDVVSIEVVPAFAGAWRGRKSYLTTDGQLMGSAEGWPFAIRMTGPLSLTLNWTHTCGGETSRSVTKYSMTWVPALAASESPQL